VNIHSSLIAEMKDKTYRDAYVASQIRVGIPLQIRALRKSRELSQPELAELAGMAQPRISEIERPGERRPNIETLLRLAAAFDVGLQVRFVPIDQLIDYTEDIDLDNFTIKTFDDLLADAEREQAIPKKLPQQAKANRSGWQLLQGNGQLSDANQWKNEVNHAAIAAERKNEVNDAARAAAGGAR
jgi:transcriptional regulator with XRE-family HTH domain